MSINPDYINNQDIWARERNAQPTDLERLQIEKIIYAVEEQNKLEQEKQDNGT